MVLFPREYPRGCRILSHSVASYYTIFDIDWRRRGDGSSDGIKQMCESEGSCLAFALHSHRTMGAMTRLTNMRRCNVPIQSDETCIGSVCSRTRPWFSVLDIERSAGQEGLGRSKSGQILGLHSHKTSLQQATTLLVFHHVNHISLAHLTLPLFTKKQHLPDAHPAQRDTSRRPNVSP